MIESTKIMVEGNQESDKISLALTMDQIKLIQTGLSDSLMMNDKVRSYKGLSKNTIESINIEVGKIIDLNTFITSSLASRADVILERLNKG